MYVNNVNATLEIADSWGVARPVVALMQKWDVGNVLYLWGGAAYLISVQAIKYHTPWTPGHKPPYHQVPRRAWTKVKPGTIVTIPRTDDVLTLSFDESDRTYAPEQAQQLAML